MTADCKTIAVAACATLLAVVCTGWCIAAGTVARLAFRPRWPVPYASGAAAAR